MTHEALKSTTQFSYTSHAVVVIEDYELLALINGGARGIDAAYSRSNGLADVQCGPNTVCRPNVLCVDANVSCGAPTNVACVNQGC